MKEKAQLIYTKKQVDWKKGLGIPHITGFHFRLVLQHPKCRSCQNDIKFGSQAYLEDEDVKPPMKNKLKSRVYKFKKRCLDGEDSNEWLRLRNPHIRCADCGVGYSLCHRVIISNE